MGQSKVQSDESLSEAGAIGAAPLPTVAGGATIGTVVSAAVTAAKDAALGGSSTATQGAVSALSHAITELGETAASAVNPAVGDIVTAEGSYIESGLTRILGALAAEVSTIKQKIGSEVGPEVSALVNWFKSL